jgi:hypothetical protein
MHHHAGDTALTLAERGSRAEAAAFHASSWRSERAQPTQVHAYFFHPDHRLRRRLGCESTVVER